MMQAAVVFAVAVAVLYCLQCYLEYRKANASIGCVDIFIVVS